MSCFDNRLRKYYALLLNIGVLHYAKKKERNNNEIKCK